MSVGFLNFGNFGNVLMFIFAPFSIFGYVSRVQVVDPLFSIALESLLIILSRQM